MAGPRVEDIDWERVTHKRSIGKKLSPSNMQGPAVDAGTIAATGKLMACRLWWRLKTDPKDALF